MLEIQLTNGKKAKISDNLSIETRFCFSYDTATVKETQAYCEKCAKDENYFLSENLKRLDFDDDKLRGVLYLNSQGYIDILKGEILTPDDKVILKKAYDLRREKFLKRLKTYLKKYGLSKCEFWTYDSWD